MAEAIRDGTGTIGADAKVGSDNRLWVRTEGIQIGSLSVTAGSEVFMPGGSVVVEGVVNVLGSTHVTQSTDPWVVLGSVHNVNSPSVTVGSESVITAGSVQTYSQVGSVEVWQDTGTNLIVNGSIHQLTDPWIILGSVHNVNSPSVTVGSESVIVAGSVQTYSQVGSVEVWQDTASNMVVDIGNIGSVRAILDDPVSVGSLTTQGVSFSSGTGFIDVIQSTDPWIVLGSVAISSPISVSVGSEAVITAGSVQTYSQVGSVEVWQQTGTDMIMNGSIHQLTDPWIVVGSTDVTQGTSPWVVSGLNSWNGIGSSDLLSASINAASGTAVQVVAGVAANKIHVYSYKLVCGSTLSLSWLDETTAMEGSQFYAANGGIVESMVPPSYLFRAGTGSALQLATTGNVAGRVSYFVG